jgi:chromosome segregation ATPase
VDVGTLIEHGLTVVGSGGAGFIGSWLKYRRAKQLVDAKQLLAARKEARDSTELIERLKGLEEAHQSHLTALQEHINQYRSNNAGWLLELNTIKNELEEDKAIRAAITAERSSRPDPLEDLRRELTEIRKNIERIREKGARYVKNDAFADFVKTQEEQWREMNRHLGRLEGLMKQT